MSLMADGESKFRHSQAWKLYSHIIVTTRLVLYIYLYSLIHGSLCSGSESKWKRNERSNYNCTCCLRNSHNWNKNPLSGYLKTEIKETFYLSKIWCLTIISLIHSSLRRGLFPVMHDSSASYTKSVTFTCNLDPEKSLIRFWDSMKISTCEQGDTQVIFTDALVYNLKIRRLLAVRLFS